MKNYISTKDIVDLKHCLLEIKEIAKDKFQDKQLGNHKTIGLFFFNPSLRTRLSTQKAASNLGLNTIVMNVTKEGWALELDDGQVMNSTKSEHIKEAAQVMSTYCDIIGVRAFPLLENREEDYQEKVINAFVKYAKVPIVNLESSSKHPLQALTDLYTVETFKKVKKPKVVLTWAPHPKALPQAVGNSFVEVMKRADVDLTVCHPKGYELEESIMQDVHVEYNQSKAFMDADFIYAKNWSSFTEYGKILPVEEKWIVDSEKMALTNSAKFMHCLPVRRNVVVTDEVLDSSDSLVLEQVKNRELTAQWVLKKLLENG